MFILSVGMAEAGAPNASGKKLARLFLKVLDCRNSLSKRSGLLKCPRLRVVHVPCSSGNVGPSGLKNCQYFGLIDLISLRW